MTRLSTLLDEIDSAATAGPAPDGHDRIGHRGSFVETDRGDLASTRSRTHYPGKLNQSRVSHLTQ